MQNLNLRQQIPTETSFTIRNLINHLQKINWPVQDHLSSIGKASASCPESAGSNLGGNNFFNFVFYFEARDCMFVTGALILHNMLISCVINENKTEKLKGGKSSQWKIRTYDIKIQQKQPLHLGIW